MFLTRFLLTCACLGAGALVATRQDEPKSSGLQDPQPETKPAETFVKPFEATAWRDLVYRQSEKSLPLLWCYYASDDNAFGLTLAALDPALRKQLSLPDDRGLLVTSVVADGAGDQVGFKPNDIICALGNDLVLQNGDLERLLKKLGEDVGSIKILRSGKNAELKVRAVTSVSFAPASPATPRFYLGLETVAPDDTLRSHLELPEGHGLVVSRVVDDSPAQKAKLQVGDILLKLGDRPLADTDSLVAQIQSTKGETAKLTLVRAGKTQSIDVTPIARTDSEETKSTWTARWVKDARPPYSISYGYALNDLRLQGLSSSIDNQFQEASRALRDHDRVSQLQSISSTLQAVNNATQTATAEERLKALKAQVDALQQAIEELQKAIEK